MKISFFRSKDLLGARIAVIDIISSLKFQDYKWEQLH